MNYHHYQVNNPLPPRYPSLETGKMVTETQRLLELENEIRRLRSVTRGYRIVAMIFLALALILLFAACSGADRFVGLPDDDIPADTATTPTFGVGPPAYSACTPDALNLKLNEQQPMPAVTVYNSDDLVIKDVAIGWRARGFAAGCLHYVYGLNAITHLWASAIPCDGELSPVVVWQGKTYLYGGCIIKVTAN
jgi:hypothetical protein